MEEIKMDVAVIGGGPGGYSAALYCARSGYSVAVIERLSPGGQMATTGQVDNYPGFDEGIDGFELEKREGCGALRRCNRLCRCCLNNLEAQPKRIETTSGVFTARAVVLATGAVARKLEVEGEDKLVGRGVAYCATCDGMLYRDKTVVVVGGGNSAVTDALYFSKICKKAYLLHRRDTLRASKVYLDSLKNSGVKFLWNSRVKELMKPPAPVFPVYLLSEMCGPSQCGRL